MKYYYYSPFTDKETEGHSINNLPDVTQPIVAGQDLNSGSLASEQGWDEGEGSWAMAFNAKFQGMPKHSVIKMTHILK